MTPLSTTLLSHLYFSSRYHPSIPDFLRSASFLVALYIHIYPLKVEFVPSNDLSLIVLPLLRSLRMQGELREISMYFIAPNLTRLAIRALASLIGYFPKVVGIKRCQFFTRWRSYVNYDLSDCLAL